MEALQSNACVTGHSSESYPSLLRECARLKSFHDGNRLHRRIIIEGLEKNIVLANHLVDMYGKCGQIMEARHTFDRMPCYNVYSWMAISSAYNNLGLAGEVLILYEKLCRSISPDKYIVVAVLNACASLRALDRGREVHIYMNKLGSEIDSFVQSALVDMYITCGCILDAYHVFSGTEDRNVVLWNAMILGCVQHGCYAEAFALVKDMHERGIVPDHLTYMGSIQLNANMGLLEEVRQHHMELVIFDYVADIHLSNTVIDAYSKCGSFQDACGVFESMVKKDVVSYNVMIASYIQQGLNEKAISLYYQMKPEGLKPNETTFVNVLKACTALRDGESGTNFHEEILNGGCKINSFIASSLIDMYCKCGMLADGYEVFVTTEDPNVVVWTAMIVGYTQQGLAKEALDLYMKMEQSGVKPNEATLTSVLKACSILGEQAMGHTIHQQLKKSQLYSNTLVLNSLIEMHASFGNMEKAHQAFEEMSERDVVSWTALIGGYSQQGFVKKALALFGQMLRSHVKPNSITFITVLSACSHAGLLEEGCIYFYTMVEEHGIIPGSDQYACVVDLLGRAGHLEEAAKVIIGMEVQQTELVWRTLLGACRILSHKSLAKFAMKRLALLNPQNDAAYVLLNNTDDMKNCFWPVETETLEMATMSDLSVNTTSGIRASVEADLKMCEV